MNARRNRNGFATTSTARPPTSSTASSSETGLLTVAGVKIERTAGHDEHGGVARPSAA